MLEYIECIKRTCKVDDFNLETSEEQRLDWLGNSVFGVEFSVPRLLELGRSEKKRFDLSFFLSSNTASNSNNKLDYFSNCLF